MIAGADAAVTTRELAHEALLYRDEEHLLSVALPFLREGLDAGEIVVVVTGHNDRLREALGADAGRVEFLDAVEWFARPATTYWSYRQFVDERLAASDAPARVLAEAVWATRTREEVSEWERLEAVVNAAFASAPMRVVCCYDRRRTPNALQQRASATHPAFCDADGVADSDGYHEPERFIDLLERTLELPEPSPDARRHLVGADLVALREFFRSAATAAGLDTARSDDVVLATHELVTNQLKYSSGPGEALAWLDDGALVCEIRDWSGSRPPALGGYVRLHEDQTNGWGLALVRQLADLVHVARRDDHSAIRVVFRR